MWYNIPYIILYSMLICRVKKIIEYYGSFVVRFNCNNRYIVAGVHILGSVLYRLSSNSLVFLVVLAHNWKRFYCLSHMHSAKHTFILEYTGTIFLFTKILSDYLSLHIDIYYIYIGIIRLQNLRLVIIITGTYQHFFNPI